MTDTNRLIEQLAARAAPVKRLPAPWQRTLQWMAVATLVTSIIVLSRGVHPGWALDMATPGAAMEWMGSVLTGALAAYAAFQISVPGRSPSWAWLPLPGALLWMTGVCVGCLGEFANLGAVAFAYQDHSVECAMAITFTSVPLGLVMLLMVRHAGVVRPGPTALLAALSAAAISAAAVSIIHLPETALMGLLWHVGAVVLLSAGSRLMGNHLFAWIGYARR